MTESMGKKSERTNYGGQAVPLKAGRSGVTGERKAP